ncbi:membrane protein [Sneathiella chinensis]|uniref:Membrane protein n=2 Tax=Sneathiella chinensis TaxID=349750 RepID=A0ABQ5U6S6_9PROT|nr:membrane protein [Sneathiella chinensis]
MVFEQISSSGELEKLKSGVSRLALGAVMLAVAGCSTPDWADPTDWFDGSSGDADRPQQIEQPLDEEGEYPNLGDVPEEPGTTVSIEDARTIQEGLKADRANAQYTDESLRADTAVQPTPKRKRTTPPAPAPAATTSAVGPAVTASPVPPVTAAPVQVPPVPNSAAPVTPGAVSAAPATAGQMPAAAPITSPQQAYAQTVPGTGTVVIDGNVGNVYQQQLAASAATTTTLPANTHFQPAPMQPLGASAVTVPQIVQDTYNQPMAAGYNAAVSGGAAPAYGAGVSVPGASSAKPDAVIYFDVGSSRIGSGDRQKLSAIANAQKSGGGVIRIVGHASSRTRELPLDRHLMVNLRMSQERSSAVVTSLINMGVPSEQIVVESVSDRMRVSDESMPSEEAKNRRTEIFLVR